MLGPLLRGASSQEQSDDELVLHFTHKSHMERLEEELDDPRGREAIEDAVAEAFGVKLKVRAARASGDGAPRNGPGSEMDSPLVRTAMAMGARVIDEGSPEDGGSS